MMMITMMMMVMMMMMMMMMMVIQCLLHMLMVQGYRCRKAYIATQGPMVETTEDFWRMLWEHNSSIVVMMTKVKEMGVVSLQLAFSHDIGLFSFS